MALVPCPCISLALPPFQSLALRGVASSSYPHNLNRIFGKHLHHSYRITLYCIRDHLWLHIDIIICFRVDTNLSISISSQRQWSVITRARVHCVLQTNIQRKSRACVGNQSAQIFTGLVDANGGYSPRL